MNQITRIIGVLLSVVGAAFATSALAEEGTISAYSPWQGSGQIYPTAVDRATFVGAFHGMMFVDREDGLVISGHIVCPAILEISLVDGTQAGHGLCTMSHANGERIFVNWRCSGSHLAGCSGEFSFTGGTGEYEGITGGGKLLALSAVNEFTALIPGSVVQRTATGMAIWRDIHYTLPERSQAPEAQ